MVNDKIKNYIIQNYLKIFKTIFIGLAFLTFLIVFSYYFFGYAYRLQLLSSPCELCLKYNDFLEPCFKYQQKYIYDFKNEGESLSGKQYYVNFTPQ